MNSTTISQYGHYFGTNEAGRKVFQPTSYVTLDDAKGLLDSLGIDHGAGLTDSGDVVVTVVSATHGIDVSRTAETSREAWALALGAAYEQATTPAPVEADYSETPVEEDEAIAFLSANGVDLSDAESLLNAAKLAVKVLRVIVDKAEDLI